MLLIAVVVARMAVGVPVRSGGIIVVIGLGTIVVRVTVAVVLVLSLVLIVVVGIVTLITILITIFRVGVLLKREHIRSYRLILVRFELTSRKSLERINTRSTRSHLSCHHLVLELTVIVSRRKPVNQAQKEKTVAKRAHLFAMKFLSTSARSGVPSSI